MRARRQFFSASLIVVCSISVLAQTSGPVTITPRARPTAKEPAAPKSNIRIDTTVVQIPVTVTDPLNRFVTGLEKKDFRLFEDKVEQSIVQFSSEDGPLS